MSIASQFYNSLQKHAAHVFVNITLLTGLVVNMTAFLYCVTVLFIDKLLNYIVKKSSECDCVGKGHGSESKSTIHEWSTNCCINCLITVE